MSAGSASEASLDRKHLPPRASRAQTAAINEATDEPTPEPSDEMERIQKLWEILSSRSDIDHPLCVECTDVLIDGMNKKLEAATRDRDVLAAALKELQAHVPSENEVKEAEDGLRAAREEEKTALGELLALEREKSEVDAELSRLSLESREMYLKEKEFWKSRNAFDTKFALFKGECESIRAKYEHDSQMLEMLQRSNVYNDTFCISHDGTFATINGLRLGRSSGSKNVLVDWPEINAAWGHALLLLVTVAEKLDFRFDGFEPVPVGSTSRIIRLEQPSSMESSGIVPGRLQSFLPPPPAAPRRISLDLFYSSENIGLGRMFSRGRFGDAMVAFLELVRQLGAHVFRQTSRPPAEGLRIPYAIKDDRIGEVSVRLGIGQDEAWTKACKLILTCCKFLLAHASNANSRTMARGQ